MALIIKFNVEGSIITEIYVPQKCHIFKIAFQPSQLTLKVNISHYEV